MCDTQCFALIGDEVVSARIAGLFSSCPPAAVVFRVTQCIVDTVQRVLGRRARTHVSQKLLERFPFWANGNATTAVQGELNVGWIQASLTHRTPDVVFTPVRSLFHRMSVSGDSLRMLFGFQTTTRMRQALEQILFADISNGSTVTLTLPPRRKLSAWSWSEHSPSAKSVCGLNHP